MTVDRFEMKAVIDDLASNKSPGLDGLSAEHFKFAHSILSELMSTLVSSIVVHGHLPQSMNESVIVPIIKDKKKRVKALFFNFLVYGFLGGKNGSVGRKKIHFFQKALLCQVVEKSYRYMEIVLKSDEYHQ